MADTDRSIHGVAKTVTEILANQKYTIDYYQREYKWQAKQLRELIGDLTTKFQDSYDPSHARGDVASYPTYFLGSIIISRKGSDLHVVDGQQRLTSLTLFLIYLRHLQTQNQTTVAIDQLVYSEEYGIKSFNLDVPDRNSCMEGLFDRGTYEPNVEEPESVHTLVNRYSEIDGLFPDELKRDALPFFIDWLTKRVQLVEITAYTDDDAYSIFETMNDRGLRLTSTDMLKGYLLANMHDGAPRTKANELWRTRLRALNDYDEDNDADFLKTWLRSQYASTIRERRRDAQPQDWDRIGTEFHRWVRGHREEIGLDNRDDFYQFVSRDFDFYSHQYEKIIRATNREFEPGGPLRFIRFNADLGFTLQNQLLLAPLSPDDPERVVDQKLELVGHFINILLAWRIWNFRSTAYSTMQYAMFLAMRDIRGLEAPELGEKLRQRLHEEKETFDNNDRLYMHQQNRSQLHKILARITDYVTVESGQASNYIELTNGEKIRYEVEHIWADHYERRRDEFNHETEFAEHRNRIGGLLLLPKQFNASYNDDKYVSKVRHYYSQNVLAASLNSLSYEKNPGFKSFVARTGLNFRPYEDFTRAAIDERSELYREIAKHVWNPDNLLTTVKNEK